MVKEFLRAGGNCNSDKLIAEISRFIETIRPDRASARNLKAKSFVPFEHRVPYYITIYNPAIFEKVFFQQ